MISIRLFILNILCLLVILPSGAEPMEESSLKDEQKDTIEISLLTCAPGDEVYSLYGHTAIRYKEIHGKFDEIANYGMFSFHKPFFILRFIFGLTDYEMGVAPFEYFEKEYYYEGRDIIEQILNLTDNEKLNLLKALQINYLPENRVYRYNYFYDNCTTRARDIIVDNINGEVIYPYSKGEGLTYRELVHSFNEDYPWARFGNDLLLGLKCDKKTTLKESQFLPYNLMADFSKAQIKDKDGSIRNLVEKEDVVVKTIENKVEKEFPLRPRECALIIFIFLILISLLEFFTKKDLWLVDTLLMVIDGLLGIIIFLLFFSSHPTTSTNLNIFLFNPLPLIFVYRVTKKAILKTKTKFYYFAILSIILFFIGGIFQDYAEGTYILALSLLLRCLWKCYRQKDYLL